MTKLQKSLAVLLLILFVDQFLKIWIKTHMTLGEEIHVLGDWFIIHFTENNGMAFGMEFWGVTGKVLLTLFRILALAGIGWYLLHLIKKDSPMGLVFSITLVMAGALGNIIDSVFYGVLFSESYPGVANFLPAGGGYAPLLQGRVVDMFYFPVLKRYYPEWFPFNSNEPFIFFRPVFNIADSAITIGVFSILIFQRRFFTHSTEQKDQ